MSYITQGSQPCITVGRSTDCNYICDGTADETQILAAIERLEGENGGVAFLKPGAYSIDDIIDFSDADEVYLIGSGRGVTSLTATNSLGAADPMFYLTTSGNHIERMSIDMSDEGDNCIENNGGNSNVIKDIAITNVVQDGINQYAAAERNSNKIIDVSIAQPGRWGIYMDDNVGHSWIERCVISDSTGATKTSTGGIFIGWGGQQILTRNVMWGLETAVLVDGGVYRMQFNDNTLTGNWTHIEVNGTNGLLQFCNNLFWTVGLNQAAAAGVQNSDLYFNTASGQYGVLICNNVANGYESARAEHFIHCTTDNILRGIMIGNSARDYDGTVYDIGTQTNLVTTGGNHNN